MGIRVMPWRIYFPSLAALAAIIVWSPTAGAIACLVVLRIIRWLGRKDPTGSGDPLGFFSGK